VHHLKVSSVGTTVFTNCGILSQAAEFAHLLQNFVEFGTGECHAV